MLSGRDYEKILSPLKLPDVFNLTGKDNICSTMLL